MGWINLLWGKSTEGNFSRWGNSEQVFGWWEDFPHPPSKENSVIYGMAVLFNYIWMNTTLHNLLCQYEIQNQPYLDKHYFAYSSLSYLIQKHHQPTASDFLM